MRAHPSTTMACGRTADAACFCVRIVNEPTDPFGLAALLGLALWRCGSDAHSFAGSGEDAQDLSGLLPCAAEPVRYRGVEFGNLARPEHPVLVAEDEPHLARQHRRSTHARRALVARV